MGDKLLSIQQQIRVAICPLTLTGADYRRAHEACHQAALLWNRAVNWVHTEWKAGNNPEKYEIQSFLTSLPRDERPLHAHTTEIVAHDLYEAIRTFRANRKNGMRLRTPWRKKNYRPLSFSRNFGWRTSKGKLHLSFGRGRPRIDLPIPAFSDSATGKPVPPELWGEIQLCWDNDARRWSLHIPYETERPGSVGDEVTAVDEGIINSMALASWVDDKTIDITIINGREARAIKRQRNKSVGSIQKKLSRCKNGSRRHRRLVAAKRKVKARAKRQLRDFNHQVSYKAASHVIAHNTGRLVVGDLRGIEQKTRQRRSANRHQRQRLSQWERGIQERYLGEKTGLEIEYLDESDSTKTCPVCGARNRPKGRDYRCQACSFACHRDAVGAINILQKALYGSYVPIGADVEVSVTYLRAVERWSEGQRKAHSHVQRRKARALSIAQNRASIVVTRKSKPKLASPSTSSSEPGRLAVVA
jgi:putative transposase